MDLRQLQMAVKNILLEHTGDSAGFEAFCLVQLATGKERQQILLGKGEPVPQEQQQKALELAQQRAKGYPLQYLLGQWEFYGREYSVGEGVLIPRPDTETICDWAIEWINGRQLQIVDLCAGSGCIGITLALECPGCMVDAVELSPQAIPYLSKNIVRHHANVTLTEGDVLQEQLVHQVRTFDLIVSNPPYLTAQDMEELQKEVTYEPAMALYGQQDGLYFYWEITRLWKEKLNPGGMVAYEIGMDQEQDVIKILQEHGFVQIGCRQDLNHITRVVYGMKPAD